MNSSISPLEGEPRVSLQRNSHLTCKSACAIIVEALGAIACVGIIMMILSQQGVDPLGLNDFVSLIDSKWLYIGLGLTTIVEVAVAVALFCGRSSGGQSKSLKPPEGETKGSPQRVKPDEKRGYNGHVIIQNGNLAPAPEKLCGPHEFNPIYVDQHYSQEGKKEVQKIKVLFDQRKRGEYYIIASKLAEEDLFILVYDLPDKEKAFVRFFTNEETATKCARDNSLLNYLELSQMVFDKNADHFKLLKANETHVFEEVELSGTIIHVLIFRSGSGQPKFDYARDKKELCQMMGRYQLTDIQGVFIGSDESSDAKILLKKALCDKESGLIVKRGLEKILISPNVVAKLELVIDGERRFLLLKAYKKESRFEFSYLNFESEAKREKFLGSTEGGSLVDVEPVFKQDHEFTKSYFKKVATEEAKNTLARYSKLLSKRGKKECAVLSFKQGKGEIFTSVLRSEGKIIVRHFDAPPTPPSGFVDYKKIEDAVYSEGGLVQEHHLAEILAMHGDATSFKVNYNDLIKDPTAEAREIFLYFFNQNSTLHFNYAENQETLDKEMELIGLIERGDLVKELNQNAFYEQIYNKGYLIENDGVENKLQSVGDYQRKEASYGGKTYILILFRSADQKIRCRIFKEEESEQVKLYALALGLKRDVDNPSQKLAFTETVQEQKISSKGAQDPVAAAYDDDSWGEAYEEDNPLD